MDEGEVNAGIPFDAFVLNREHPSDALRAAELRFLSPSLVHFTLKNGIGK